MNTAESDAQTCLSENLLLLREDVKKSRNLDELYTIILNGPRTDKMASKSINADLRMLDLISACLTTGELGDSVAAVFEKRGGLTLILARSGGTCSATDIATTHQFISALQTANHWTDLLPFLIKHSKLNMNTRIQEVRESISDLFDSGYLESAMDDEQDEFDKNDMNSFLGLLHKCRQDTDLRVKEGAIELSSAKYKLLHDLAKKLVQSELLKALSKRGFVALRAQRLLRRLELICQYSGLKLLIRLFKRLHSVPFRWIECSRDHLRNTILFSEDPAGSITRCSEFTSIPEDDTTRQFFRLLENWRGHVVHPHIHPEVFILLHYIRSLPEEEKKPKIKTVVPLGCSNRLCVSCATLIILLNLHSKIFWKTSGCSGKIYYDWALPATADTMGIIDWDTMQSSILEDVTDHQWSAQMTPWNQRWRREEASSRDEGSRASTEEMASNFQI